jgi:serine/threonine protein kinase
MVPVDAAGGDFSDGLAGQQMYTDADAQEVACVLLQAIKHLHQVPIVHRNLKPENLLLQDAVYNTSILVADFEFSRRLTSEKKSC